MIAGLGIGSRRPGLGGAASFQDLGTGIGAKAGVFGIRRPEIRAFRHVPQPRFPSSVPNQPLTPRTQRALQMSYSES